MHSLQVTKTGINVRERERLTSGAQRVFPVRLQFSSDWDDLAPKAVFTDGTKKVASAIVDGVVNIPTEVLTVGKTVCIQITGFDESGLTMLPTIVAALGAGPVVCGRIDGKNEEPPTPELSAQILTAAKNAEKSAGAAEESAIAAEKAAEASAEQAKQTAAFVTDAGGIADRIDTAAKEVARNAENAANRANEAQESMEAADAAADEAKKSETAALDAQKMATNAQHATEENKTQTDADRKATGADRKATASFAEQATAAAKKAEASASLAEQKAATSGYILFDITDDGDLEMTASDTVTEIDFQLTDGNLEVIYGE